MEARELRRFFPRLAVLFLACGLGIAPGDEDSPGAERIPEQTACAVRERVDREGFAETVARDREDVRLMGAVARMTRSEILPLGLHRVTGLVAVEIREFLVFRIAQFVSERLRRVFERAFARGPAATGRDGIIVVAGGEFPRKRHARARPILHEIRVAGRRGQLRGGQG